MSLTETVDYLGQKIAKTPIVVEVLSRSPKHQLLVPGYIYSNTTVGKGVNSSNFLMKFIGPKTSCHQKMMMAKGGIQQQQEKPSFSIFNPCFGHSGKRTATESFFVLCFTTLGYLLA